MASDRATNTGTEFTGAGGFPATVDVDVARVIVPLDGSPFAERALAVGRWVAGAVGAPIHAVEVVVSDEDAENATRYLDATSRHHHVPAWDVIQSDDVPGALLEAAEAVPGTLVCVATHGRDRSTAVVGSVAAALLDGSETPVLLAGPQARPVDEPGAAVVAAVDGTPRDRTLLGTAAGWARRLGRRLMIVTVAEPAPPSYREHGEETRARGPDDPERYLATLAASVAGAGVDVGTEVVYDPVSVRDGLVPLLERSAALVVLGTVRRRGLPRLVLGSHAARIVHDAPVPALAVPLPGQAARSAA